MGLGVAKVNKEALLQLWSLLLDTLVPHKADGGLQSSPRQASGSQDHQGFFLCDSQSGKQSHPYQCLPCPSPKPLLASCLSSVLHPASPGGGLPGLWVSGQGLPL